MRTRHACHRPGCTGRLCRDWHGERICIACGRGETEPRQPTAEVKEEASLKINSTNYAKGIYRVDFRPPIA